MTTPAVRRPARRVDGAIDAATFRRQQAKAMREDPALTSQVVELLRTCGFLAQHQRPAFERGKPRTAIQGDAGYPDVAAVHKRSGVIVYAELKRWGYGVKSLPTPEQDEWLTLYGRTPGVLAVCWDTLDWLDGRIEAVVTNPAELARLAALPYQPKERR